MTRISLIPRLFSIRRLSSIRRLLLPAIAGCGALAMLWLPASAAEYAVTASKPDNLYVIDMKGREIVKHYKIPGPGNSVTAVEVASNGIVYAVVNNYKDITGIDLRTGKEVFRAKTAHAADERTINLGLAISPDGSKIYSYEIPARTHPDRYEALPTRISVYAADGGLEATPVKEFTDVPRRIHILIANPDGKRLYALGWDLYTLDAETGEILDTYPLRNWRRENAGPPDMLNFWPMHETSGVFSSLLTYVRTDLEESDPEAFVLGALTLDVETGEADIRPFKVEPRVYFTGTVAPDRRHLFAGYLMLSKFDLETGQELKTVPLDHSYYQINLSFDGSEVYTAGTMCDIGVYSTEDLSKLGEVVLPDCPDMGPASFRMVELDLEE